MITQRLQISKTEGLKHFLLSTLKIAFYTIIVTSIFIGLILIIKPYYFNIAFSQIQNIPPKFLHADTLSTFEYVSR